MEPLLGVLLLSIIANILSQIAKYAESSSHYTELLSQIERILTGKSIPTDSLEAQLEEAVEQLTSASQQVGIVMSHIHAEVEKRRKEAENLRIVIGELQKEYESNKSLANLSADEANAVRQLLTREVSILKKRSYLPDLLINFSVGTLFFVLGILITIFLGI
ncbi:MAG: hypothetical protein KJ069_16350 [Anaerolineae bacterium]|nr:hypothetical protein [Anaerolineae bacterium]